MKIFTQLLLFVLILSGCEIKERRLKKLISFKVEYNWKHSSALYKNGQLYLPSNLYSKEGIGFGLKCYSDYGIQKWVSKFNSHPILLFGNEICYYDNDSLNGINIESGICRNIMNSTGVYFSNGNQLVLFDYVKIGRAHV